MWNSCGHQKFAHKPLIEHWWNLFKASKGTPKWLHVSSFRAKPVQRTVRNRLKQNNLYVELRKTRYNWHVVFSCSHSTGARLASQYIATISSGQSLRSVKNDFVGKKQDPATRMMSGVWTKDNMRIAICVGGDHDGASGRWREAWHTLYVVRLWRHTVEAKVPRTTLAAFSLNHCGDLGWGFFCDARPTGTKEAQQRTISPQEERDEEYRGRRLANREGKPPIDLNNIYLDEKIMTWCWTRNRSRSICG